MTASPWTIRGLRSALAIGTAKPSALAEQALANSNRNLHRNTYLWQDPAWTRAEALRAEAMARGDGGPFGDGRAALWGLPVSVKDCFDLAGAPTTVGVHFYRDLNGKAKRDSWLVERLRAVGAVIVGKTHLHPLAYGITGQNPEFGDCLQPRDPTALTGGSSSGAVASIQEGSALAAIGTDTGGSVRVPAALGGLAGYRSTLGWGDWRGGAHLAKSFDTMGWIFRDLEDAPLLSGIFSPSESASTANYKSFAVVEQSFLHDCEPEIVANLHACVRELEALGLQPARIDTSWWADALEIFLPIQASEAAQVHAGHFNHFAPNDRERLEGGASIRPDKIAALRLRHAAFRARMDDLLAKHQLLLLPAAPVSRLDAGADHSKTRPRVLRYTLPVSLSGMPTVTIPFAVGGMQLVAARGCDHQLLQFAAKVGARRNANEFAPTA